MRHKGARDLRSSFLPRHELPLILIADDDEDNCEMYADFLSVSGFRVAEATDGIQAFRLAQQLRPALIVLDLHMPKVDGISVVRHIRGDEKISPTPILVVTADDSQEQEALDAGADAVLVKPCMPADIARHIQRMLAQPVRAK